MKEVRKKRADFLPVLCDGDLDAASARIREMLGR